MLTHGMARNQTKQGYHPALLPMLDAATDVRRAESLSLLEDGLRLWHVTLTQTEAYDAQGGRRMWVCGGKMQHLFYTYVCTC